jgi:hypothetical protein
MPKCDSTAVLADGKQDRLQIALLIAALAILVPVLLQCLVTFSPTIYFDTDPRITPGSPADTSINVITTFGPAGAAWLHIISVLIAAGAIAVSIRAGGSIRWLSCVLVGAGMLACAYHMTQAFTNLLQGGAWIAAAALGLAAVHLGQHQMARRVMVAGLIALLIPMAIDAIWFIFVEHARTVAFFHNNADATLRSQGIEVGSPQHELYVRRLESPDAISVFILSNVLGSIVVALTLLTFTITVGAMRHPAKRGAVLIAAAVTVLGLIALYLTHSKGAALTLPAGVLLVGLCMLLKGRRLSRVLLTTAAIGLIAAAIIAVLVRGSMGDAPTAAGERSLLFRFYYWQASARMVTDDMPGSAVLGVGPANFGQLYLQEKNPLNPEEVVSAHNVFVDYMTMLGLGGWAWCAVLLIWIVAAAYGASRAPPGEEGFLPIAAAQKPELVAGPIILAAAIFAVQYIIEFPLYEFATVLLWLMSVVAFAMVMIVLLRSGLLAAGSIGIGLFVAATAVVMHNQIEMSFFNAQSVAVVWVIVAVAGVQNTSVNPIVRRQKLWQFVPSTAILVIAVVMMVGYAVPITAQQHHLRQAATDLRLGAPLEAIKQLDSAGRLMPTDLRTLKWRLQLRVEMAAAIAQADYRDAARLILDEAFALVKTYEQGDFQPVTIDRHRARLHQAAADLLGDPSHLAKAAASLETAITKAPYNIADHLGLADLYDQRLDKPERAGELYQRVLELHDLNYLDPARQLSLQQYQRVTDRLAALGGSS